jgi:hypothetical protein
LGPPPLSVQMTPVPAQIMHLKASRLWVRRGYRQEARRGTQATQHRFASQDGTIFETHNRDDCLVGPFSTEVT